MRVKWKANDGKLRPGLGILVKGCIYEMPESKAKSYIKQGLASAYKEEKSDLIIKKEK